MQEKITGGVQGRGSGLVGGPGAEPHGHRKIFENLQKIPKKIAKIAVFSPIFPINYKSMR